MSQLDLFAPAISGTEEVKANRRGPFPSPFDGLIHQVKEVTNEKGTRYIRVSCGAEVPKYLSKDTMAGASVWWRDVTCPACQYHPKTTPVEETHP